MPRGQSDSRWITHEYHLFSFKWPTGDEWRGSDCHQPWVTRLIFFQMTHGWWLESIGLSSVVSYSKWVY